MFRNNSNMPTSMDTIGLSAGVTPLPTNNSTDPSSDTATLRHEGDFKMKTRITNTSKRTGMWIGVAMLALALGIGTMRSDTFAASTGNPFQGRTQPNYQAGKSAPSMNPGQAL